MNVPAIVQRAARAARKRRVLSALLLAAPALQVAAALAWRSDYAPWSLALLAIVIGVAIAAAVIGAHRINRRWITRQLDRRRDMQDSAELLFVPPDQLQGLPFL